MTMVLITSNVKFQDRKFFIFLNAYDVPKNCQDLQIDFCRIECFIFESIDQNVKNIIFMQNAREAMRD